MTTESIGAASLPRMTSLPAKDPAALMGILRELEASLLGSQIAVVRLDLEGIERGTREQIELVAKLAALPQRVAAAQKNFLSSPVRECGLETLQAARVQAALLARVRSKLRVLGNMLAGPSSTYGPFGGANREPARVGMGIDSRGGSELCRA